VFDGYFSFYLITDSLSNLSFPQPLDSPTSRFSNLSFHQPLVSPTSRFSNLSFPQPLVSPTSRFPNLSFPQPLVQSYNWSLQSKQNGSFHPNTTIPHKHQHPNMATCFGLLLTIFRPIFSSREYSPCPLYTSWDPILCKSVLTNNYKLSISIQWNQRDALFFLFIKN
jgi:hypothetical protein